MVATFQKTVNAQPAPAVEGDFASANPRRTLLAGPGALTAGALLLVGRFAFARNDNGVTNNAHPGVACRFGFVQRDQIALITAWLGSDTMQVPAGVECSLFDGGDYWARFAGGAAIGTSVFADFVTGLCSTTIPAGASFTGVIAANVLTVSALTGTVKPGAPLSGTGVTAGSIIGPQLTGPIGGAGTYTVAGTTTAASTAMTTTGGVDTNFKVQSTAAAGELAKISHISSNLA